MAEQIISKRCYKCKNTKPITEFCKNRSIKDGHCNECKICHLKSVIKYHQTEKGKTTHRKSQKKYRKTEKGKAKLKGFYARYPNYIKAKSAVNNAIRDGKLPRPDNLLCHYCPKPAQQYHHHKGYEPKHWLDVIPVCTECHHNLK